MSDHVAVSVFPSGDLIRRGPKNVTLSHPVFKCTPEQTILVPRVLTVEVVNEMLNVSIAVSFTCEAEETTTLSLANLAKAVISSAAARSLEDSSGSFGMSWEGDFDTSATPSWVVLGVQVQAPSPIPVQNDTLFSYQSKISIPISVEKEVDYDPSKYSTFFVAPELYNALAQRMDADPSASFLFAFRRVLKPEVAGQGFEDVNGFKYIAKSAIPFGDLAKPGVSQIHGTADVVRDRSVPTPAPSKAKPAKGTPPELLVEASPEADPFADAHCQISFSVSISKAFLPLPGDRERPSMSELMALVPKVQTTAKLEDAYEDFDSEVVAIARELVLHAREVNVDRRAFVQELNASGKYLEVKERLRRVVARVVRDKFPSFVNDVSFINDIYVHLVHKLHAVIDGVQHASKSPEDQSSTSADEGNSKVDFAALAVEAERDGCHELAQSFHNEVIAANPASVDAYLGAACFVLRSSHSQSRLASAEGYLRNAIGRNKPANAVLAMLTLAFVYMEEESADKARVLLECGIDAYPQQDETRRLLWSALWLCSEYPRDKLKYLNMEFPGTGLDVICRSLLDKLMSLHLVVLAERFLLSTQVAQALSQTERTIYEAKLWLLMEDPHRVLSTLQSGAQNTWEVFLLTGRAHESLGHYEEALTQWSAALTKLEQADIAGPDVTDLRFRYAKLLMNTGAFELAAGEFAKSHSWKHTGICLFRSGHADEAEVALNAANQLNPFDPQIWQYLVLVSISRGALVCADACLTYARKFGFSDRAATLEIAEQWAAAAVLVKDRQQLDNAEALAMSLENAESDPRVLNILAVVREGKGDVEEAAQYRKQASQCV